MKKKVLIIDSDRSLVRKIKERVKNYLFDAAYDGFSALEKIESFAPDLIVVSLLLPGIHGMEILRKVKTGPRTEHIGVLLAMEFSSGQNYHSALMNHVDFILEKPFELKALSHLFSTYFKKGLHPLSFHEKKASKIKDYYNPKISPPASYIKFWGTRGSNPVSGPDYVRFGGNTSCLEVRHKEDLVIFDAGTGIRSLSTHFAAKPPKEIHIVLSHFHFDHLSGFPFFDPIYNSSCTIHVWTPIGYEKSSREIFSEMLTYALFPVRLEDMKARVLFHDIQEGVPFRIGQIEIHSHYAYHPGATLCFKIRCENQTFGYVTDSEFLMGYHGHPLRASKEQLAPYSSYISFFKGCDLMIHEAQYSPEEYRHKAGWGHSSVSNAALLMKLIDTRHWIITHHDPGHTDNELFKKMQLHYDILQELKIDCHARMAVDSLIFPM
jgi:phosphoribosyl 1,2-cyclic phosphodiesterase